MGRELRREMSRGVRGEIKQMVSKLSSRIEKSYEGNSKLASESSPLWLEFISCGSGSGSDSSGTDIVSILRNAVSNVKQEELIDYLGKARSAEHAALVAISYISSVFEEGTFRNNTTFMNGVAIKTLELFEGPKHLKLGVVRLIVDNLPHLAILRPLEEVSISSFYDIMLLAKMYILNILAPPRHKNDELSAYATFRDMINDMETTLSNYTIELFLRFYETGKLSDNTLEELLESVDIEYSGLDHDNCRGMVLLTQLAMVDTTFYTKLHFDYFELQDVYLQLKDRLTTANFKLDKTKKQLVAEREIIKGLQANQKSKSELETLKQENARLKKELGVLENKNARLQSRLDSLTKPVEVVSPVVEPVVVEEELKLPEVISADEKIKYLNQFRLTILGGPTNFSNKINKFLPKAKVIDKTCKFGDIKIGKSDFVIIYSNVLGHARVMQMETQINHEETEVLYVSSTNRELFVDEMYNLISKKKLSEKSA